LTAALTNGVVVLLFTNVVQQQGGHTEHI